MKAGQVSISQNSFAVQIHIFHRKFAAQIKIIRRKTCCPNLGRDLSPLLKHTELILGRGYKTHTLTAVSVVDVLRIQERIVEAHGPCVEDTVV